MMLQFESAQPAADFKQQQQDQEDDETLGREQIKRMMNKMQEMQRVHQQDQHQHKNHLLLEGAIKCGAINVNCRRPTKNCDRPHFIQMTMKDEEGVKEGDADGPMVRFREEAASHELIKRRFFEKLERRKSLAPPNHSQIPITSTTPTTMMIHRRSRNFMSELSNLREESEYGYGFATVAAAGSTSASFSTSSSCSAVGGCEILVDERGASNINKDDYLNNNNNQLFVCDSAQISAASCLKVAPTPTVDEQTSKDITCKPTDDDDNALTRDDDDDEGEAVYLTLDWKNVQVNENKTVESSSNKEQSSRTTPAMAQNGQLHFVEPFDDDDDDEMLEQKQIKQARENSKPNENNKPQELAGGEQPDMHNQYKRPISLSERQQHQQVSSPAAAAAGMKRRETQVLVVGEGKCDAYGNGSQQRVNEADLVILPKKSVNSSSSSSNNRQHEITLSMSAASMRKNLSAMKTNRIRNHRYAEETSSNSSGRLSRAMRRRHRLMYCRERCSSSSSSGSSSSSSSGLTSSPSSSSSSLCSLEDHQLDRRVPPASMMTRLEQLSLSEDDLKSLISQSKHCSCSSRTISKCRCEPKEYSLQSASSSQLRRERRMNDNHSSSADDDCCLDTKQDDSSNSSSGNSSATRSLMISLFNHPQASTPTKTSSSICNQTAAATTKSVPNLIVVNNNNGGSSLSQIRTPDLRQQLRHSSKQSKRSSGKFWSLFGGSSSIGSSHANTPLPPKLPQTSDQIRSQQATTLRLRQRERKQTSDDRDSSSAIYSVPLNLQPRTAGYRLHLPAATSCSEQQQQQHSRQLLSKSARPQEQQIYATLANNNKYHSCTKHRGTNNQDHHQHQHHHHQHHHHGRHKHNRHHHRHHRRHQHHRDDRGHRSWSNSRGHAQSNLSSAEPEGASKMEHHESDVRGQLIEINKLDGSQTVELEREPGKSWGFFVARGSINKTKGIFISRLQYYDDDDDNQVRAKSCQKTPLAGLLGVGDRLLAIDEQQIVGPDYDILRVNRLISKKNKILLKVKPFKG